jgi:hypothetical protein
MKLTLFDAARASPVTIGVHNRCSDLKKTASPTAKIAAQSSSASGRIKLADYAHRDLNHVNCMAPIVDFARN